MFFGKRRIGRIFFLSLLFICGSFFVLTQIIFAEGENGEESRENPTILISEIQIGSTTADDEFVELYNPNAYDVSLEGWSLKKKTKSGTEYNILSDIGKKIKPETDPEDGILDDSETVLSIPAGGYFLIVPRYACGTSGNEKCYSGEEGGLVADNYYSRQERLADNNALILYDGEIVADKVGWGEAADFEGSAYIPDDASGKNFARVITGGIMADTGNNSEDFSLVGIPSPQNSSGQVVVASASPDDASGADDAETDDASGTVPAAEEGVEGNIGADMAGEDDAENIPGSEAADAVDAGDGGDAISSDITSAPQEKKIVITEFLTSPTGDDKQAEFIEVHNAGSAAADIGGWKLEDQVGKLGSHVFPEGTKLRAGEYRALYSSTTKLSLNNSGDGAVLKDEDGNTISTTPLCGEAEEDVSFAEKDGNWSWTLTPTPGSENVIRTKEKEAGTEEAVKKEQKEEITDEADKEDLSSGEMDYDFADGVVLHEIFPDPSGRDNREGNYEWVELYNENDRDVDLIGWCLDDVLGKGSKAFCFAGSRIVAAHGYLILDSSETRLAFNNTEEEVNLLWPDKRIVDAVSYEKAEGGYSYSLDAGGNWEWSGEATPGAANVLDKEEKAADASFGVSDTDHGGTGKEWNEDGEVLDAFWAAEGDYESLPIAEAKSLPLGSLVETVGLVSAPYGTLGKDILYMTGKDTGDGIQVAGSGEALSAFLLGDEIGMVGELGEVGGEKRLLYKGAARKLSGDNLLEAFALDFADLAGSLGSLVSVEGEVSAVTDATLFYLRTADGEMKIYAEPETGILLPDLLAGEKAAVTGILSRTSLGYRILPRFVSDIRFLENDDSGIIGKSGKVAPAAKGGSIFPRHSFLFVILLVSFLWKSPRIKESLVRLRAKSAHGGRIINP